MKVTAIDLYPADLDDMPGNLEVECCNLNRSLNSYPSGHYDLIHSRLLGPGIDKSRWPGYVRDLLRLLKRGGWVQLVEFYYIFQSDSGRLQDNSYLHHWGQYFRQTMDQHLRKDPRVGRELGTLLRTAGFVDVQERTYRMPIGGWSTGTCKTLCPDAMSAVERFIITTAFLVGRLLRSA